MGQASKPAASACRVGEPRTARVGRDRRQSNVRWCCWWCKMLVQLITLARRDSFHGRAHARKPGPSTPQMLALLSLAHRLAPSHTQPHTYSYNRYPARSPNSSSTSALPSVLIDLITCTSVFCGATFGSKAVLSSTSSVRSQLPLLPHPTPLSILSPPLSHLPLPLRPRSSPHLHLPSDLPSHL